MRIRYGKPIKVKSLLSNCFSSTILTPSSRATVVLVRSSTGSIITGQGINTGYGVYSIITGHKYAYFLKMSSLSPDTTTSRRWALWDITNNQFLNYPTTTKVNDIYLADWVSTKTTSVYNTFQINYSSNVVATMNPEYMIAIDLTEIGLDNLTAEEFYNKYNKYFPLIATGEEITIDDKAGQVSLGPKLPLEYQEVEYIEGDGGQYMSSISNLNDKSIDGNLTVGYKFQVTVHDRAMYFSTIEASMSAGQTYSLGYLGATGHLYIRWNQIANSTTEVTGYQVGDILEITRTNNVQTTLKRYSLFTHGDSKSLTWKGRIYKYWLKLNDEYLFNWIPCYRKSDNVIGLYDLISGTFATNIGTGTFLKGNNVNSTISCKVAGGSSDIYYGYNQLAEIPETTGTKWKGYNCTMTAENGIATCIANGNDYPALASQFYNIIYELDHIYMHLAKFKQDTAVTGGAFGINTNGMSTRLSGNSTTVVGEWVDLYFFSKGQGASTYQNTFNIQGGSHAVSGATFYVKDCICIDLTDWFGAGKEPTTVQEFKEKFIKDYYGFCPTPIKLTRYQIEALPSYGYNQLIKNGNFVDSSNWSITENTQRRPSINNNIYTIETLTQGYAISIEQSNNAQFLYSNHKYLVHFEGKGTSANSSTHLQASIKLYSYVNSATIFNQPYQDLTNEFKDFYSIITPTQTTSGTSANGGFRIYYQSNTGLSYVGDKVQMKNIYVIDLSDWYGEGNEPTTVEEFKQTFPNKYYPYSKKRLLNKYMINKLEN